MTLRQRWLGESEHSDKWNPCRRAALMPRGGLRESDNPAHWMDCQPKARGMLCIRRRTRPAVPARLRAPQTFGIEGDILLPGSSIIAVRRSRAITVKTEQPHGEWLPWLDAEFGWSDATAKNYMSVARAFKSLTVGDFERPDHRRDRLDAET